MTAGWVPVAGRRVHVLRLDGDPALPTLVFLHEALGSARLWRHFPADLCVATGCPGLVFDRLGFGASDPPPGPRARDYLHRDAQDLLPGLLAALGLGAVIPIGHSDGGTIALLFAAARPDLAAAVITEAAHVLVEPATLAGIRQAVAAYKAGDLAPKLARHHGDRTESVFRAWADTWLAPWFRDWDITAELAGVTCPVLALQGADDAYGTPAQLAAIAAAVRGPVTTQLLPGRGHAPHHEARADVIAIMARFVAGVTGRTAP